MCAFEQIKVCIGPLSPVPILILFAFVRRPHPVTSGKDTSDFCMYLCVYVCMQTVCTILEMLVEYEPLAAFTILVLWQI